MDKFRNKYRISSTRLQNWNYRWNAVYYVTICTRDQHCYFGEIAEGRMVLSRIGIIANVLWHEIAKHCKNVELGPFVVMPNHIHGILIISGNNDDGQNVTDIGVETTHALSLRSGETPHAINVETTHALSLRTGETNPGVTGDAAIGKSRFQHQGRNTLSSLVGSYKSAVSKHAHRLGFEFAWQSRFYDRIIRDEQAYLIISDYIINNPLKWDEDKYRLPD